MPTIRPAAVAGMFYPAERARLSADVDALLSTAAQSQQTSMAPKAIIAPHAGYVYSGAVAASAYVHLRKARNVIRRVVLLGPVHRVPVRGLALPTAEAFETPLGRVPIDLAAIESIRHLPQIVESAAVHEHEHSLEVHLPFLQRLFENFTLVPLAVGDATREQVAEVLDALWGGPETLIVISSDLSHYLPYEAAHKIDASGAGSSICAVISSSRVRQHREWADARRCAPRLSSLVRNSGDTAGSRDRVVGYGSFVRPEIPCSMPASCWDRKGRNRPQLGGVSAATALTWLRNPARRLLL
jgi:AmmeMemoRadiSam system protein B